MFFKFMSILELKGWQFPPSTRKFLRLGATLDRLEFPGICSFLQSSSDVETSVIYGSGYNRISHVSFFLCFVTSCYPKTFSIQTISKELTSTQTFLIQCSRHHMPKQESIQAAEGQHQEFPSGPERRGGRWIKDAFRPSTVIYKGRKTQECSQFNIFLLIYTNSTRSISLEKFLTVSPCPNCHRLQLLSVSIYQCIHSNCFTEFVIQIPEISESAFSS